MERIIYLVSNYGKKLIYFIFFLFFFSVLFTDKSFAEKPEIVVQSGHTKNMNEIKYSQDGKYLATGDEKSIKIWEVSSGKLLKTLNESSFSKNFIFTQNNESLVSQFKDTINIWDISSGKLIKSVKNEVLEKISSFSLSSEGKILASSYNEESAKNFVWDLESAITIKTFDTLSNSDRSFLSLNGEYIIINSSDQNSNYYLYIYEISSGKLIKKIPFQFIPGGYYGYNISFNSDLGYFLVNIPCYDDCPDVNNGYGVVELWDISSGKIIKKFKNSSTATFAPDSKYIATGGDIITKSIKIWDIESEKLEQVISGNVSSIDNLSYSPNGKYIFSLTKKGYVHYDEKINVFDAESGKLINTINGNKTGISSITYSKDGKYLATRGIFDKTIKIFEISSGKLIKSFFSGGTYNYCNGSCGEPPSITYSPDGNYLAGNVDSHDPKIRIWDVKTGKIVKTIDSGCQPSGFSSKNIGLVEYNSDGKYITSSCNKAIVFDVKTGKIVKTFKDASRNSDAIFSPDGKYILIPSKGYILDPISKKMTEYDSEGNSVPNKINIYEFNSGKLIKSITAKDLSLFKYTPDFKYLFTYNNNFKCSIWDISSGKLIKTIDALSLSYSPDGKKIAAGRTDGTIKILNSKDFKEIISIVPLGNKDWVTLTPDGYFDSSENGKNLIHWVVGMNIYSLDQFFDEYYTPNLFAKVMSGEQIASNKSIKDGFALPPEVTISNPKEGQTFDTDQIEVTVQVKDIGGGMEDIRLYHNGKIVSKDTRGLAIKSGQKTENIKFNLSLVNGNNTLKATAYSKDRVESNPYQLSIFLSEPKKESTLHLLSIGINKYKNPDLNLNFAENDAKSISNFFDSNVSNLFSSINKKELYNNEATKQGILDSFKSIESKSKIQDVVVIYMGGHGEMVKDNWYFVPHDAVYPENEEYLKKNGLSDVDISNALKEIKAQKIVLLLDSCKSGGAIVKIAQSRGTDERKTLMQLSRSTGVYIVAASTKNQFATELESLKHGIFTYCILEGLNGKADKNKDNKITIGELIVYIQDELPNISEKYKSESQYPVINSTGMDFPIVLKN